MFRLNHVRASCSIFNCGQRLFLFFSQIIRDGGTLINRQLQESCFNKLIIQTSVYIVVQLYEACTRGKK